MEWRKCANDEEKAFLQQLTGSIAKSEKQNRCVVTSFYSQAWMREVIKKYLGELTLTNLHFTGGYEDAERQVAICGYNEYMDAEGPLRALEIKVKTGIGKALSHRDFLGAILGLGIDRAKVGDIIVKPFGAYVIIVEELADYVICHLHEISRYGKVEIRPIQLCQMEMEEKKFKEVTGTVQSLRADAIFALAFGISRTLTSKLLQQDKGKCNGMGVKSTDILKVGDIGTLRGYGKMRFEAVNGTTKKDRIHIKIQKYI